MTPKAPTNAVELIPYAEVALCHDLVETLNAIRFSVSRARADASTLCSVLNVDEVVSNARPNPGESGTVQSSDTYCADLRAQNDILGQHLQVLQQARKSGHGYAKQLLKRIERIAQDIEAQRLGVYSVVSQLHPELLPADQREEYTRTSPVGILQAMLPYYERRASEHGLSIRCDLSDAVTCPEMNLNVFGMQRAFHTLLTNAIKYSYTSMPARERYIRIWVKCVDKVQRTWGFFVQNFGVGILPEELARVFLPGERGIMASLERRPGCGLGLAEAKKSVESHGGIIRMRSRPTSTDPHWHHEAPAHARAVYVTTVWIVLPEDTVSRRRPMNG